MVTVRYLNHGLGRKRVISRGPLHPDYQRANRWAEFLRHAGDYYDVRVESGNAASQSNLHSERDD